jgi:electron transfer flavoprotein beta subunit
MLAELLGIPHISVTLKLEINGATLRAETEMDEGKAILETTLPAVVSTQQGLNEPRYPSLKGIMSAKKKEIKVYNAADLGLTAGEAGKQGSKLDIVSMEPPLARPAGRIIEGETVEEKAQALYKALHEEVKAI